MTAARTLATHPLLAPTGGQRDARPALVPARPGRSRGTAAATALSLVRAVPGLALVALVLLEGLGG